MSQIKIKKGTFHHVESELAAYHETRKEIVRVKNELLNEKSPGCPGTMIMKHRQLEQMQMIVDAIEGVVFRLTPDKQELVKLRYWTNPQLLTWDGIAHRLFCNRTTAIRWRDEIVAAVAERIGWR
ncbi:transcriptional regulator [Paenibacillus sp. S-38]|uniref:transcriptional regulator n=1 Tax=Paenibacillus sp. S-38 TaxID=3416710 RepID=UPI003CF67E49